VSFNKLASSRYRSTTVSAGGFIKAKDGVVRKINTNN
jgi:hypothetical protein